MPRLLRTLSLIAVLGIAAPALVPDHAVAAATTPRLDLGIPKPVMNFLKENWKMLYIAVDELIDDLTRCGCPKPPTPTEPPPGPDPAIG